MVIVQLGNLILIVALPTIQQDLGASPSELQWMVDAYTLVFAALLFTSGSLGDRFGRKLALTTGLGFFGLASLVTAFSVNPEMLIAFRAVMGVGAALILPATLAKLRRLTADTSKPPAEQSPCFSTELQREINGVRDRCVKQV